LQQLRAQVAELKQKELIAAQDLGDKHPALIKMRAELDMTEQRLEAEIDKVIESVKNDYTAALEYEQSVARALEEQKAEVLTLSRQTVEYNALQRQATSDRQLYERLLSEAQTRGIAGKTVERKIRIIESAELPRQPVSPHRRREMLLAGFCALLLALSAPIIRETLDHRVKTAADIEKRLNLRCLTMVPIANKADLSTEGTPLFGHQANAFNEAFRRLRTAVALATPHAAPTRLMVTSALPHEGKSVVSTNLAIALAQMKQRVLLVDADLRRPKVHRMLGLKPFPGLADLLTTNATTETAVQATNVPYLSVLACGMKHATTSELLATGSVERVFAQIAKEFDFVVFDSPPTGPVADACLIGQYVDFAVFVTHADATPVSAARLAVEQLEAAGVTLAGAVLNGVNLKHAGYYSAYYAGGYSDYYTKSPTGAARKPAPAEGSNQAASV
jgi:capsular exopolysaccharide synthesis family protein